MRRPIATTITAVIAAVSLAACGLTPTDSGTTTTVATSSTATSSAAGSNLVTTEGAAAAVESALSDNEPGHAEDDDADYDAGDTTTIALSGESATVQGSGAAVEGSVVTISEPGTYVVSGTLDDGRLLVDSSAEGQVRIVLDGASITSSTGSPFVVEAADEVVLVLADGSASTLTDAASYPASDDADAPNAALYSMADLTIAGSGSLAVTGRSTDGIASKDGLVIQSGTVTVTAVDDAIRGKDYLIVTGGTVTAEAGGDALTSDNEDDATKGYIAILDGSVTVTSVKDAVDAQNEVVFAGGTTLINAQDDAVHTEGNIVIGDASVTVESANEGLEARTIVIAGGATSLTTSDDAVNGSSGASSGGGPGGGGGAASGNSLTISGGVVTVSAEGDGLDVNGGPATITGGTVIVAGPVSQGNGSLDVDGGLTMSGGVLLAAGSAGMAGAPTTESAQGWLSATLPSTIPAGTVVQIVSGDTVVATYTTVKEVSSIVYSSSEIEAGATYAIYTGGSPADEPVAGWTAGGDLAGATELAAVTAGQHTGGRGGPRGPRP